MAVLGTRGLTFVSDAGQFMCPCCGPAAYEQKRVRRFLLFFEVPVLPLDPMGEYVECCRCRRTYSADVLEFRPSSANDVFLSQFDHAARGLMAQMVLVDGLVLDDEIAAVVRISGRKTGQALTTSEARALIAQAAVSADDVLTYVMQIRNNLNQEGKETLLEVAAAIAAADGSVAIEERELLRELGDALGLSDGVVTAALERAVREFDDR